MKFGHTNLRKPFLACAIASVALFAFGAPVAQAAGPKQMDMVVVGKPADRHAVVAERKAYHDWLRSERVSASGRNPLAVEATDEQIASVDFAPKQAPEVVGFSQAVGYEVSFRDVKLSRLRSGSQALKFGAIEGAADGGYVYSLELSSPGAYAMRVEFSNFKLPKGAAVYLYSEQGQVAGPYVGRGPMHTGEFTSNTMAGDHITLQVRQLGKTNAQSLRGASFTVAGLGHIRPRYDQGECLGVNEACVVNAACNVDSHPAAVDQARDAVGHMLFRSGAYYYICSGGLINNNDTAANPLFLTANHCLSKGNVASTLEVYFQYESSSCSNASCDAAYDSMIYNPNTWPGGATVGATIVKTGKTADYTLLRLAEAPPNGSVFLGWTSSNVANANNTVLYRFSHPSGAPQSYSTQRVDTSAPTCGTWPRGPRIYSRDLIGATEGGSSGSPVLNAAGQIVGQLSGACGTNVGDVCDDTANATVDGAFAYYFNEVEPYLGGSVCVPSTEVCDGQDNDCDGAVDEGDVCGGGGGGLPPGSACNVNADCASNNCKGKPGAKTCK